MKERFNILVKEMPKLLEELKNKPLLARDELKKIPQKQKGIYVFYENNKPLYVGRSNRLKERIQEHGRPSSDHYSATLAFTIAKERMNFNRNKRRLATRNDLEKAPGFKEEFFLARKQVAAMQVKVVKIEDQIAQTLFEIYAHLALKTKYNDFGTH
ncbi:MAG: GIY-YIG nuclease family protein [Dehalococcoidales bacterium]|nr:GIY-YIG nuclease family protein [Dehalococcoidales bacterium]